MGAGGLRRLLQTLGPAAGVVIDAQDFQHVVANSVGNDKRRFGNDELPRPGNTAGRPKLRIFPKEMLDAIEDVKCDAFGWGGIIRGDMGTQGKKIANALGGPLKRHTPFGNGRSLRVSHEATHSLTRS
jgi:hypothetical protein